MSGLQSTSFKRDLMSLGQIKALFYSAALFNWSAVVILVLLAHPLGLEPPLQSLFGQITLGAIVVFGCGYWMVGWSPSAYRGVVALGILGKLAIVAIVWAGWLSGTVTPQMAALVSGDVIYSLLFVRFLQRTAA